MTALSRARRRLILTGALPQRAPVPDTCPTLVRHLSDGAPTPCLTRFPPRSLEVPCSF